MYPVNKSFKPSRKASHFTILFKISVMKKLYFYACMLLLCCKANGQHYSQLKWVEWGQASQDLKDEFKSVMMVADQTAYESIIGNYQAALAEKRKIYVASFDVNNDKKNEHAVLSEMDRSLSGAPYHLIYYKDIGREQVRTLLNDLDITFTNTGILHHTTKSIPFYVYDNRIKKIKKYVEKSESTAVVKKTDDKKLSVEAAILFKGVPSKLSVYEKNFITDACGLQLNKTKTKFIATQDKQYSVKAYTTDMNGDGTEEVFVDQSGSSFGNTGNYFNLFFKNDKGAYESVAGVIAIPLITNTSWNGYPELLMGGSGMAMNIWRFDGKEYKWNRDDRDKEVVYVGVDAASEAYHSGKKSIVANHGTIQSEQHADKKNVAASVNTKPQSVTEVAVLSPLAQFLFRDCKTNLSNADKNELTALAELIAADTVGSGKKNKLKVEYHVYPVDLNSDGVEEIFVRSSTKFLGIPVHRYSFFARDASGHYRAAPGKFGEGANIIVNGKPAYPDLVARPLVSDGTGNLNLWSWNGKAYYLSGKITSADSRKYRNIDIEYKSNEYASQLK